MNDNQPANVDKQIDQLLEALYLDLHNIRHREPDENPSQTGEDVETAYDQTTAAIKQLLVAERIDELISLSKKQQTFVGYGYDDVGVDISDIDDRIAALQSQLTDGESAWLAPK